MNGGDLYSELVLYDSSIFYPTMTQSTRKTSINLHIDIPQSRYIDIRDYNVVAGL